jgi:hypothetical protein
MSHRKSSLPKSLSWLGALLLLMAFSACCSPMLYDTEAFRKIPLDEKIASYKRAASEKRVCSEKEILLSAMADHGYAAADAMTELLNHPDPSFPLDDVATVLELTHYKGADLREHEALRALTRIADTSPDAAARARAKRAVEEIRKHSPK